MVISKSLRWASLKYNMNNPGLETEDTPCKDALGLFRTPGANEY